MESRSLYTILGIRPDASADQIERAYAERLHQLKDGAEAHQQAQLQQRQQYEQEARERRMREQALGDSREADYRLQREARAKQQAAREQQYQQQQEEAR